MPRRTATVETTESLKNQAPAERHRAITVEVPYSVMQEIVAIEGKGVLARGILRDKLREIAQEAITDKLKGNVLTIAGNLLTASLGGPVGVPVEATED